MADSRMTQKRIDEIRMAYAEHKTYAAAGRACGASERTVKRIVTSDKPVEPTAIPDVELIKRTYAEHGTLAATAALLPYSEKIIRRTLLEAGVDTSVPGHNEAEVVRVFLENDRNLNATQQQLGIGHYQLKRILRKHKQDLPTSGGRVTYREPTDLPLPEPGEIQRYILTSAQNNTPIHEKFWANLRAASEVLEAEIMVSRYTYNKGAWASAKAVKVGHEPTRDDLEECWYDDRLVEYFCDGPGKPERYRLAPGLVWCSEMNILPTASSPLTSLEGYTRRESGIFPHAKLQMRSVASMKEEATKFNWTTGTVTQRNYIQKLAGLKAEFGHSYAALLVEVNSDGSWWVRQLEADDEGVFYDLDKRFDDGTYTVGHRPAAINPGDTHASEIDPEAHELLIQIIDELSPRNLMLNDLQSFRARTHHEQKSFGRLYEKFCAGEDSVDEENRVTAKIANDYVRPDQDIWVISSNHDRHGERWLDDADFKKDLLNAEHYLEAQLARIRAIKSGDKTWSYCEWSLRRSGLDPSINFLGLDEPLVIAGIECGLHGDLGPNGARGSTKNLTKLGRKINKGHDHQATIEDGVWSAGACQLNFPYMKGPTSHSVTHILTYENGSRTMITCWLGDYRARA